MSKNQRDITVSVGIPVYNEEENISDLLKNILSQKISSPFMLEEIIVVASGCTDKTPEIVEDMGKENNKIKLIYEKERRGKASALNIIFQEIKSDIIILMGGDVLPRMNSLDRLIRPFDKPAIGAVSGHPIPINEPKSFADTASCLIWDLHDLFSQERDVKLTGEFFAIRTGIIKRIFSKINCDDALIEVLIKKKKYKIKYVRDAIVDIKGPETFKDFLAQRRRIHSGHRQIKQITEKSVKTTNIRENILAVTKIIKKYYKKGWFFPTILVEIIARIQGYIDFLKGNYQFIWKRIDSTKDLKRRRE